MGENINNSNDEIKQVLKTEYENLAWTILSLMEVVFAHKKDDGTQNEKTYNVIRSKILRASNDKVRDLNKLFESYTAFKVVDFLPQKNEEMERIVVDFRKQWFLNKERK